MCNKGCGLHSCDLETARVYLILQVDAVAYGYSRAICKDLYMYTSRKPCVLDCLRAFADPKELHETVLLSYMCRAYA